MVFRDKDNKILGKWDLMTYAELLAQLITGLFYGLVIFIMINLALLILKKPTLVELLFMGVDKFKADQGI